MTDAPGFDEWDRTLAINLSAMFHVCKAAVPIMKPGASIIGSSSVNSDAPNPTLMPYAATKAAIANNLTRRQALGVEAQRRLLKEKCLAGRRSGTG
jgi:NAD(P)-dependent dehydrogenase (short-subunit alcohol dehydrogenase family)